MNLALGIVFLWLGAVSIYVAVHGMDLLGGRGVTGPWEAFTWVMQKIGES